MQAIPYENRRINGRRCEIKGHTLREMMIEDIATKVSKSWKEHVLIKSYFQKKANTITTDRLSTTPFSRRRLSCIVDKNFNDTWKETAKLKNEKYLLPSQRKWIKQCFYFANQDTQCLIDMTNDRIRELESQRGK